MKDTYDDRCHLVVFNHIASSRFQPHVGPNRYAKAFLIRLEPFAIAPHQYSQSVIQRYDYVLTLGSLDSSSGDYLPWPYYFERNPLNPTNEELLLEEATLDSETMLRLWNQRPIELSLVASNKVSPTQQSNYDMRRHIVHEMPELYVFGNLWKDGLYEAVRHRASVAWNSLRNGYIPSLRSIYGHLHWKYPHTRGSVPDKRIVGRQSRFSLVIENDNHYVSEKLIDAIAVGSIPIFIGGSLSASSIPREVAKEGLSSVEEIRNYIKSISEEEVLEMLTAGRTFLNSNFFQNLHLGPVVYKKLADVIAKHILN